jgi:two-component system, NarL family, response regulator LiaR
MMSQQRIRVLLADDHSKVHRTISAIISHLPDIDLVAQASSGAEAIHLCVEYQPDIVLMDVVMPEMDGIQASRLIHAQFPAIKILALSSFRDEESIREMIKAGAVGYVLKGSSIDDLANTLRLTYRNMAVFSSDVTSILLHRDTRPSEDYGLTDREIEILRLLIEGLNNREIGEALTISRATVKFHLGSIFSKLAVSSRVEATALAITQNLVPQQD